MTNSNIAGAINDAHANVERAKRQAVLYAIECGRLLEQAKATVPHGGWTAWLAEHCQFSERTAQLYMKSAKYVGDDPAKAQRVADLSLRDLAALMAKPSSDEQSVSRLLVGWTDAEGVARVTFALELLERDEIDLRTFKVMCSAAGLSEGQAARNVVEFLSKRHPNLLAPLSDALEKGATPASIAKAMTAIRPAIGR